MSLPTYEDLVEENAFLKGELGLQRDETAYAALRDAYGLPPNCCKVLVALYQAKGRVVSGWQLLDLLNPEGESSKLVQVYISRIRRVLGKGSVKNAWAKGYSLSPEAVQNIRETISGGLEPVRERAA